MPGVTWCESVLEAAEGADAAVVLTEWNEFRAVSLEAMKAKMHGNVLADLRNIYRASHAREAGLRYVSIGRPATVPDAEIRGLGRAAEVRYWHRRCDKRQFRTGSRRWAGSACLTARQSLRAF